jgi:hypothetical protein
MELTDLGLKISFNLGPRLHKSSDQVMFRFDFRSRRKLFSDAEPVSLCAAPAPHYSLF